MNNKELFEYVQQETASEEELNLIWNSSRSVKIRKQIAMNPNASAWILEQAARLYLEEVIENPAFQMLALFDDNGWVGNISKAYQSPPSVIYSSMRWIRTNTNTDTLFRAALLSENLDLDSLDTIVTGISAVALKRALKRQETKKRIQNILLNEKKAFSLESALILRKENAFDDVFLAQVLREKIPQGTSASKSNFKKFFLNQVEKYNSLETSDLEKEQISLVLFEVIAKVRSHCLNWITRELYLLNINYTTIELFATVLYNLQELTSKSKVMQSMLNDNIRSIKYIINFYFRNLFSYTKEGKHKETIEKIYSICNTFNLSETGMDRVGIKFASEEWLNALDNCSNNIKEFFCKEKTLGTWFAINFSDKKFKIIDSVNENIFAKNGVEGDLLYKECSLKKIITLPNAHVF